MNNAEAQQRYKAIKYYKADNKPLQRVNIGIFQSQGMAFEEKKRGFLALILPQRAENELYSPVFCKGSSSTLILCINAVCWCIVLFTGFRWLNGTNFPTILVNYICMLHFMNHKCILCVCRYMLRRKKKDGHDT